MGSSHLVWLHVWHGLGGNCDAWCTMFPVCSHSEARPCTTATADAHLAQARAHPSCCPKVSSATASCPHTAPFPSCPTPTCLWRLHHCADLLPSPCTDAPAVGGHAAVSLTHQLGLAILGTRLHQLMSLSHLHTWPVRAVRRAGEAEGGGGQRTCRSHRPQTGSAVRAHRLPAWKMAHATVNGGV